MPKHSPDVLPHTTPLADVPDLEEIADTDALIDPEGRMCLGDHTGVSMALSLLSDREYEVMVRSAGLGEGGEPYSRQEISAELGITLNSVSSTLRRARNRLREVPDILGVING